MSGSAVRRAGAAALAAAAAAAAAAVAIAAVAMLSALLSERAARAGDDEDIIQDPIFGSRDLAPLGDLLAPGSDARQRLDALRECLSLWWVAARAAPPEDGEDERYRISFDFGLPDRGTARVLRLSFTSVRPAGEPRFRVIESDESWMALPTSVRRPSLEGPLALDVLARLAASIEFRDELSSWLAESAGAPVRQIRLEPAAPPASGGASQYIATFYRHGREDAALAESKRWQASIDPAAGLFSVSDDGL